jgi:drug/metabolite transporter (DMT)-like permease
VSEQRVAAATLGQWNGVAFIILAVVIFVILDTCAKALSRFYPVFFVVWVRYALQVIFLAIWYAPRMGKRLFHVKHLGLQLTRGAAVLASSLFFFAALAQMPLADASAIAQVSPFLVTLAAVRFLGEEAPRGTYIGLGLSFLGVLLIIKPGAGIFGWEALLPICSALCYAAYQVLTRKLSHTEDPTATLFIGALVATSILSLGLPWFYQSVHFTAPSAIAGLNHGVLFLVAGLAGTVGHFFLVRAFSFAPASQLAPYLYVQSIAALTAGYFVFSQYPDAFALAGMAIIVLSGVWIALARARDVR